MKKLACALLSLMMVVGSVGCGSKQAEPATDKAAVSTETTTDAAKTGDPITISWAVFETDNYTPEFWQKIITSFEADNPGIKIKKVLMTGDSRPQYLKTLLAAGDFPDVNIDPVDLAKTDGVYAEVPAELLAKYEDAAVITFNGKKNLIPAYKAYRSQAYYNKKQFADAGITEAPKTWDEFLAACDKLKVKGHTPLITAGSKDVWATGFGYWVGVMNSEVYNKYPTFNQDLLAGKVKWNNETIASGLKNWQDLNKKGYFHKGSMSFGYTQASAEFLKGNAAIMLDGAWVAPGLDNNKDINPEEFGVFPMPVPSGVKTYCTMPQYWGVSETCKNKEAAFKFCEYVLGGNPEVYKDYLKADGVFAVTKEPVTYEMESMQTAFVNNFKDYTVVPEVTKVVGDTALPTGLEDFMNKSLQNIFVGEDVSKELDTWDTETARLLSNK